ncbi:hypothetical protein [Hyphomicrobium sp. CS1GBMeth3]|uniref:hypothetical protein n=1 Tax=Hyphomicrobium sp. CS1GBMeth3 TaxID=1892845 RepID=UPI0009306502|nr:hypothetical protein [Hyphomicrobium sp. CS1GBMeth3]
MADLSTLEALLKRVEEAKAPDIWDEDEVGGPDTVTDFDEWPDVGGHWHKPGGKFASVHEAWTASAPI